MLNNYYKTVGKRIRTLRKALKMTQEELAHEAKLNTVTISDMENGKNLQLKVETIRKVAKVFNISISVIVDEELTEEAKKTMSLIENILQRERGKSK